MDGDLIFELLELVLELIFDASRTAKKSSSNHRVNASRPVKQELVNDSMASYQSIVRTIELKMLMLSYLFQQDDGVITRDERRLIKQQLKPHVVTLHDVDFNRLKGLYKNDLSIDDIIRYIQDGKIPENDVRHQVSTLTSIARITKRHDRIIDFMKSQLYQELDMLL